MYRSLGSMKEISGASLKEHSSEIGASPDNGVAAEFWCSRSSIIRSPVYPNRASSSSCNIFLAPLRELRVVSVWLSRVIRFNWEFNLNPLKKIKKKNNLNSFSFRIAPFFYFFPSSFNYVYLYFHISINFFLTLYFLTVVLFFNCFYTRILNVIYRKKLIKSFTSD